MLIGVVERNRPIEMRSAFGDVACVQQGIAHDTMPNHERSRRALLLGECQKLRREFAHYDAVESHIVRQPNAMEDRKQQ